MPQGSQVLGEPILLDVARQLVEQIGDRDEVDVGTVCDGLDAQGHREMRLAHARRTEKDHVLTVCQEAQRGQLLDLFAVDRWLEVEVEIGQRFNEWKMRQPGLRQHSPFGARGGFGIQQAIQEIEVGEFLLARLLGNGIDQLRLGA